MDRYRLERIIILAVLALTVGHFVAGGLEKVQRNWNASAYDQRSYLQLGLKIRQGKGLTDGKRHPLYPVLISPFAEREWAYFTKSKLISLAIGAIGLLAIFLLTRRMYGDHVALLATFLLGINEEFASESARVICESLFVLLFFATWYYMAKGFSNGRYWMAAGFCAGLAYLAKGTALLVVASFFISAAIVRGRKALVRKGILTFVLLFLVASSPLLAYNLQKHRNPFYNYNTAHVIWRDSWEEKYLASGSNPTMFTYLQTHSLRDILTRQWDGMKAMMPFLAQALIPVEWRAVYGFLASPWGLLTAIGIAIGLLLLRESIIAYYQGNREEIVLTAVLFVLNYLFFAWCAPITIGPRYMLPLAPILYLLLVDFLDSAAKDFLKRLPSGGKRLPLAMPLILYALLALWLSLTGVEAAKHVGNPFQTDRLHNSDGDMVLSWLAEGTERGTKVIWGPCYTLPNWRYEGELDFKSIPKDLTTWRDFMDFVKGEGAHYAILDWEMFVRREQLLSPYFAKEEMRIGFETLPPGWALAFAYKGLPCKWCIFKLLDLEPIEHPLQVDLGSRVRLLGYDLDRCSVKPGDTIHLTLYWRALAEMERDYTVFVHLLDKGGSIRGQRDGQPLQGFVPTSAWRKGWILADRYDLVVAPDAPSGEYRIEVGIYLLETMERLPAFEGGRRLPDDRVLLDSKIWVGK